MGLFDSIKSAFSNKAEETDTTVSPSQLLRDAGIDPDGLNFGFGADSITVSGDITDEADRKKILDVLTTLPGISTVQDNMFFAEPDFFKIFDSWHPGLNQLKKFNTVPFE